MAPFWDGNETWLVLGGGGLLAAFPLAYSVILPRSTSRILFMLIGLILRGVAFEFRFKARQRRHLWDKAFNYGSLAATVAQGVVLGAFIQGLEVEGRDYAGGTFDWLTPFTLLTGVALVAGYGLLGATWLIWRTEGELQRWAYGWAKPLLLAVLGFVGVVSIWTPLLDPTIAARWFSWPNLALLSPVPLVTALVAFGLPRSSVGARCAVRVDDGSVPAVVPRADQPLAARGAAGHHDLAAAAAARDPALPDRRGRRPDPGDPGLHRVQLLRVPRQGPPRRGLGSPDRGRPAEHASSSAPRERTGV